MKKKKAFGLYGTNKRKKCWKKEKHKADIYTYEDYGYDEDAGEGGAEYGEDDEYIVDYRDGEYYAGDYAKDYYEGKPEAGPYYAEDDGEYADEDYYENYIEYDNDNEYDDEYNDEYDDEYDDDSFDTAYGRIDNRYNDRFEDGYYGGGNDDAAMSGKDSEKRSGSFFSGQKRCASNITAFDVVLLMTGVIVVAAAIVISNIFFQSKRVEEQIAAIAPLGTELSDIGTVGDNGILAITGAALSGGKDESETGTAAETESIAESSQDVPTASKVSVSFISVEKDLKIRFTDAKSEETISGVRFEVTLTNTSSKKQLVLTDDDMDGIIYAKNIRAGIFDAIITSTEKYKFPEMAQQVTVKDKVEYAVINVQDEVKTEKQVNVAVEDTQKQDAALEEVKLTDTVEWVEPTKMAIGGTETYLPVDKNTIPDPSKVSLAAARMLFDTIKVELDKSSLTLKIGETGTIKGTEFADKKEGDVEYKHSAEWKSSDEAVAAVSGGTVTAKSKGKATITYTVTRKTITTTYEPEKTEETIRLKPDDEKYINLSEEEKAKCTPIKNEAGEIIEYEYKKVTETEPKEKKSEVSEAASASCEIIVEEKSESAATSESAAKSEAASETAAAPGLALSLDRTKDVYIAVGGKTTLIASVSGHKSDAGVIWETSDKKVATVDEKGEVTGVSAGSVKIMATTKEKDSKGNQLQASCVVTVNSNAQGDTVTKLKDANGNQLYIKNSDGSYKDAVYADYYTAPEFYIKTEAQYKYTGWQTIDGKTYFYDKNGTPVKGTQIIQGVTYNFGEDGAIATSVNGSTFGIDISRHNGNIDWNAVKASGVDYAIIRCGYRGSSTGVLIQDQSFAKNIQGAVAAGLKIGIYVFSQAIDEVEAVKEASLAVACAQGYSLSYPIFIDTESSGGRADKIDKATRTAVVNAFCQTIANSGYKAGIYASKTWFEDKLNMGAIGNYRIWLAQYSKEPTYNGKYDMWQYSCKGTISGIKGNVDLNLSYMGY